MVAIRHYEMVVKTTSWIYLKSGGIFKDFVSWGSHKALRDGGKLTGPSHPPVKINTSQPIQPFLLQRPELLVSAPLLTAVNNVPNLNLTYRRTQASIKSDLTVHPKNRPLSRTSSLLRINSLSV